MSPIAIARSRVGMIRRHLSALALNESVLFPTAKVYLDAAPAQYWGYTIQMDVRHDEKIIDFVTESLTPNDKMEVYIRQKKMMRDLYPSYIITERHN
jgi:hypothetical protein